jgi:ribosomal protein L29
MATLGKDSLTEPITTKAADWGNALSRAARQYGAVLNGLTPGIDANPTQMQQLEGVAKSLENVAVAMGQRYSDLKMKPDKDFGEKQEQLSLAGIAKNPGQLIDNFDKLCGIVPEGPENDHVRDALHKAKEALMAMRARVAEGKKDSKRSTVKKWALGIAVVLTVIAVIAAGLGIGGALGPACHAIGGFFSSLFSHGAGADVAIGASVVGTVATGILGHNVRKDKAQKALGNKAVGQAGTSMELANEAAKDFQNRGAEPGQQ